MIELLIVAVQTAIGHPADLPVVIGNGLREIFDVVDGDDVAHAFSYCTGELDLVVVHMLVELQLAWYHNRDLALLQRHYETRGTAVSNDDPRPAHVLNHLGVGK